MSQHELMIPNRQGKKSQDGQNIGLPIIDLYEPIKINQATIEDTLKDHFKSLQFPLCGEYIEPNLKPITEKKKQLSKPFVDENERLLTEQNRLTYFDGIYDNLQKGEGAPNELIRLKTRIVRDLRIQYFQQNSQFVTDNQFFHNHLSRLANISSINNEAISIFQKNAILSERNNQKKSMPYQLEICIGSILINKHQLQNEQQMRFQELKPLLRTFSSLSAYPTLSQISKQIDYLKEMKEKLVQADAPTRQIQQVIRKIQICESGYKEESIKMQTLVKSIHDKWGQVKQERRKTGIQTVPWKLYIKYYEIEGVKSIDIGVNPIDIKDKQSDQNNLTHAEINRRQAIRNEKYFIKIYINNYHVATSEKVNLLWPSYQIPINAKFSVTVYSAPSDIQVQIIKSGFINRIIDTVNLTLPGMNSKTITASERRFAGAQFAGNGHKARKKQQPPNAPAGLIAYRIQWKGEGSRMPPLSFKKQEEQTAATQKTEQQDNEYIQLYDIKDPRIHHKNKRQQVEVEINRGHGALLPFINTQSARHLLLKMKATQPQFENLQIPLTEQQIGKRLDLKAVIENQKLKTLDQGGVNNEDVYNPIEGIFQRQDKQVLNQIKRILYKIQNLKLNILKGNSSAKYKITEQIINEYIFQQMESPIVVFFRNLFTQKRKLGPKVTFYLQAKNVIDNMEINIHLRSAKNIPIREESLEKIREMQQLQQEAEERRRARFQRMGPHMDNADMYANYGMGFYQRPPNMNIQGQNFFIPGMMQNQNRMNMQVNYQNQKVQRTNTYFIMRFKKILKRTRCFEGPYPQWNETIEFDYNLKNEQMTIQKLHSNNQRMIKLLLFDMVEQSLPTTVLAQVNIKKTKYYLGRVQIPMSMLIAIPSLTGLFPIDRPLILFGYGIKNNKNEGGGQSNQVQRPQICTLVNLDIFTDPIIDSIAAYNQDRKFVTGAHHQSTILLQRASDWLSDLNTKTYIRLWFNNIEGRSVFISRYLSDDIRPPPDMEESIERCARFVSLIPNKYSCKLLQNTEQFHLTCQQFMRIRMGQDHGILLCNFFNNIDKRLNRNNFHSYLVLGKAFPYGKSIFVLRRNIDTNDCQLWDPYSGHCYYFPAHQYDTFCCFIRYSKGKNSQLQKDYCNMLQIGSIVTKNNVYVNVQSSSKPDEIDFNIDDENLWKPFLSQRMKKDYFGETIESIQPPIQESFYDFSKQNNERGQQSAKQLQIQILNYLEENLKKQRLKHVTAYTFNKNKSIPSAIYQLLKSCEILKNDYRLSGIESRLYDPRIKEKYFGVLQEISQEKSKIKQKIDSQKILYGFTINLPYTTKKDILERIQQSQIHLNEVEALQFVLIIRCFEIACNLFSVWVFIGTINTKNV